mmetsp:Transcript_1874/g.2878  ORF Transcript_1874/g.2878 Transcript_1874/m.2878 type:complete len:336 (+) Transcript_1874:59-1066(+)
MESKTVIVLGSAGQVGDGIKEAFAARNWNVIAIDPKENGISSSCNVISVRSTAEEVSDKEWMSWFVDCTCCEIIYSAEEGNRDMYSSNPDLGSKNNQRFATFVERLEHIFVQGGTSKKRRLYISYCGGSWTRKEIDSQSFCVGDKSKVKEGGGSNNYERAKSSAYENAKKLAKINQDWMTILFFDYISVVPNYSPNFTMGKMVQSAMKTGKITYSAGDYGRPLLHSQQAASVLLALAEQRASAKLLTHEDPFDTFIIPGNFTSFGSFASVAKEIAAQNGKKDVKLICQKDTPDFLRSRCNSVRLVESLHFKTNGEHVLQGLKETAQRAIDEYLQE